MLNFSIAAVERDTGLSKDVLRVWERRYGFPVPKRDINGERVYSAEQVDRLRLIKRLMDQGHRPGKLIAASLDELACLAPRRVSTGRTESPLQDAGEMEDLLVLIKQHDADGYQRALQQRLARQGLSRFVLDTVAPLTHRVGQAWEEGRFEVFEEHLFTELTKRVLRQAIVALPRGPGAPKVLLTSVPDEQHILGLLMIEALLSLEGAQCIPLGTQMPVLDIVRAAKAHRVDVVALSFSVAFPRRQMGGLLEQLRSFLGSEVELWVGGGGVVRLAPPTGVLCLQSLEDGVEALLQWRHAHPER